MKNQLFHGLSYIAFLYIATALVLLMLTGCGNNNDELPDYVIASTDTPRTAGLNLAEYTHKLILTTETDEPITIPINQSASLGRTTLVGNVTISSEEIKAARAYTTTDKYRWDYQNDYAVAIYNACTDLALRTNEQETKAIIKYERSKQYKQGISGVPIMEAPEMTKIEVEQ